MSFTKSVSIRRRQKDIFKLRNADYKVQCIGQQSTYQIQFKGPQKTAYEQGRWVINLYLPEQYPYKSPSVGFLNRIFHPNIDYISGTVCLDVINQTWTPMYELVNIFEIFLPQLLTYPNPASPLNHQAAQLFQQNQEHFNKKVRQCIHKYASHQLFKDQQKSTKEEESNQLIQQQKQMEKQEDGSCSLSDHQSLGDNDQINMY